MNEQLILKLAEQASMDFSDFEQDTVDLDELKKFAELIVKECMQQVWYTREDSINGNVSEVITERMKQHFGVEE